MEGENRNASSSPLESQPTLDEYRQRETQWQQQREQLQRQLSELTTANQILQRELAESQQRAAESLRQAEEVLGEAERRKDQFLATLGHELRNPLSAIAGAVQVMSLVTPPESEISQMRQIIERQVAHLSQMINEILEVSRLARGKIQVRLVALDLVELLRHTAEDFRHTLEDGDLQVRLDLPSQPVRILGDSTRLTQVLINVLQNAAKFSNPGGVIHVGLRVDGKRQHAIITIRDQGIGISAEMMPQIFQPFAQADASLERSRGGLGLGLPLVKGLIELHGGSVRASSPGLGQGAEFTMELPIVTTRSDVHPRPLDHSHSSALRILIIDDQRDASFPMRKLLELDGHQVEVAADGPSGVAAARQFQPQVVLCDIGLPGGMNGFDVAQVLRAELRQPPPLLVAVTGYGQEEDRRLSAAAGFDRHLTKPVGQTELRQLLAAHRASRPS